MVSNGITRLILTLTSLLIIFSPIPSAAEVDQAPTRDRIEDKYKWDLSDFYPSDEAWEEALNYVKDMIPKMTEYKGKLGSSSETLAECLMMNDSLSSLIHRLWVYSASRLDEDTRVGKYNEMQNRAYGLYSELGQAGAYIEPEILKVPDSVLNKFLDGNAELSVYRFYVEDLMRRKTHVLSEELENLLAQTTSLVRSPLNTWTMINNADVKFPNVEDEEGNEIELTRGRLYKLLESTNRQVRREASEAYNEAYMKYTNGLGATLASHIEMDNFTTRARGYNNTLERSLNQDNIPVDVFHNLIKTVNNNLEPLHKYISLRKKFLGLDTLFGFDLSVPLAPEAKMEFTYEEAKEMVLDALKPLGDDYLNNVRMAFDSRWIDVYETLGKETGAHSWGTYSVHPILLLNFTGTLRNVFTLAHEMGHAMHSHYTYQNEPYIYAGHSLFTAEVASTCNEAIMVRYMIERAKTRDEKIYILNYFIDEILGTLYFQVLLSEFELKAHEVVESGGALSAESFKEIYREIIGKYYGPDYYLPEDRGFGCLRIYHFYRTYYVYQYATSYAASLMLSKMILEDQPGAREAYNEFIKMGSSDYPINILKKVGIDMTTPEPVNNALAVFADLVDQLEELLVTQ
jgi:oligoendopeptidase F